MKNISLIFIVSVLFSCGSNKVNREVSNITIEPGKNFKIRNFEGNHFGNVKYDNNNRGVGLYLQKIPNQDAYYGLLAEYLGHFEEKNFTANFLRPGKKKLLGKEKNGYLTELLERVNVYRFDRVPGKRIYNLKYLKVNNGKIESGKVVPGARLAILGKLIKGNPMKNAMLTMIINGQETKTIFSKSKRFWLKSLLSSRWEKDYVAGNYNPGYKQGDIINLELQKFDGVKNIGKADFDATTLKKERVLGTFNVREDFRGMYIFQAAPSATRPIGTEVIEDKIGIFFDVFDARGMGMDTVELVLVNPSDSYGSQMYFEEYGNSN